jgi:hypothetical protein
MQDAEFISGQDGGAFKEPNNCVLKSRFTKWNEVYNFISWVVININLLYLVSIPVTGVSHIFVS